MARIILIVEDENDIREALSDILQAEGYDIFTASNGREALERLDTIPTPSMILLDLKMPLMSGIEFRKAQLAQARLASIPVLVMSADNTPAAKIQEEEVACLKKPLDLDTLMKAIQKCIQRVS